MRRRAKTDDNHTEIIRRFRDLGATVHSTHGVGNGFPDLVVGWRGRNLLIEIKDGAKVPSERKLTPDEQRFVALWQGQVAVIESAEQVAMILNDTTRGRV